MGWLEVVRRGLRAMAQARLEEGGAMSTGPRVAVLQDAASAGNGIAMNVEGYSSITFGIVGSAGADRVVTFQASMDSTNYAGVQCTNLNTGTAALTATASGGTAQLWRFNCAGCKTVRAPLSGGSTGNVTVTASALMQT